MQLRFTHLILTAITALALVAADKPDPAQVLLESARKKAVVDGDLRAAIKQYGEIVAKYGKSDRAVSATALVRMAECYAKLGDAEARKVYERVVREYADQTEAVAIARARLGGIQPSEQGEIALRKVWTGYILGTVSADGRRLTYVDSNTGNLALHDIAAGTDHLLTSIKSEPEGSAGLSAISRDGMHVAYSWFNNNNDRVELRITSAQGNGTQRSRRLFDNEDLTYITPMDWSPDGRWIAVSLQRKDRTSQIGFVSVHDSSLRLLKSVDWRGPTRIFFSPDGHDIAYDLPASETAEQYDVFVSAVDGSREVRAVLHPSSDIVMGWAPDGKHLLFASDRLGTRGIWAQPMMSGKPQGTPRLVKADIGSGRSMGVTSAGSLYLQMAGLDRVVDIEVAHIDLATGKQLAPPVRPIQTFVGSNNNPDWSPDGRFLAYASLRGGYSFPPGRLAIQSVDTGEVRELRLQPGLLFLRGLRWAPDGRSFAVAGSDLKGRQGVFRIDAQTGDVTPIVVPTPATFPHWSPDGKRLYYRNNARSTEFTIVERDLDSGNEREVIRRNWLGPISLSPDGRSIVAKGEDPSTKSALVLLIPVGSGSPRELLRVDPPQSIANNSMGWTPDGRGVLVRKMLTLQTSELWFVPVGDGQPRRLEVDVNRMGFPPMTGIRLHPDGRRLAFASGEASTGVSQANTEAWVLEKFLPALTAKK